MVCISATIITDVEQIARDYKCFSERVGRLGIPIVLGGRAFKDKTVRGRFPAEFFAESFADVAKFTRKLNEKV
jgi:hypothetical protein